MDLTVVVVENLEGVEDEPPPLEKPEPPPPPKPPKPQPKPEPKKVEPPKPLEQVVTNIVKKVEKPKKIEKPKKEAKDEKPKKSAKELREERMRKMRESAKASKRPSRPQPNGRTDKKTLSDAEIQKLLMQGYKPGKFTQLAPNEESRCVSLIRAAFEAKWDKPPWTDTLRPMVITCQFGPGGTLVGYQLTQSSGDAKADQTILSAAKRVGRVTGLSAEFIEKYRKGIPVRFTVKPQ